MKIQSQKIAKTQGCTAGHLENRRNQEDFASSILQARTREARWWEDATVLQLSSKLDDQNTLPDHSPGLRRVSGEWVHNWARQERKEKVRVIKKRGGRSQKPWDGFEKSFYAKAWSWKNYSGPPLPRRSIGKAISLKKEETSHSQISHLQKENSIS